jgi:hypothetical protein
MRTTLTLDADVVKLLEEEVHRARKSFKQVVNDAIRRGLAPKTRPRSARRYTLEPFASQLSTGIDRNRLNALADELEDYALVAKLTRTSRAAERRSK